MAPSFRWLSLYARMGEGGIPPTAGGTLALHGIVLLNCGRTRYPADIIGELPSSSGPGRVTYF